MLAASFGVGRRWRVTTTSDISNRRHIMAMAQEGVIRCLTTPNWRVPRGTWCLLAGSLIGCGNDATGPVVRPRADASWFTPAIASQLDFTGRLPGTRPLGGQATGIDADDAIRFSNGVMKDLGPILSPFFSDDAGIPVDGANLRQCGRVDFIESAYGAFAPERTQFFRNVHGAKWLVRYCDRALRAVAEIDIAANAVGLGVDSTGGIVPKSQGTNFSFRGLPQSGMREPTVEDAAALVAKNGAGRISALPRLIHIGHGFVSYAMSYLFVQTAPDGTRTTTMVFGVSNTDLRIRAERNAPSDRDSLAEIGDSMRSFLVLQARRDDAIARSVVTELLSPAR